MLHNLLHTTVAAARSGAAGVNTGGDSRAQTMSMAQAMRTPMPDRCAHQWVFSMSTVGRPTAGGTCILTLGQAVMSVHTDLRLQPAAGDSPPRVAQDVTSDVSSGHGWRGR